MQLDPSRPLAFVGEDAADWELLEVPMEPPWLAAVAVESRKWAPVYVLVLFYGIPILFATINHFLD